MSLHLIPKIYTTAEIEALGFSTAFSETATGTRAGTDAGVNVTSGTYWTAVGINAGKSATTASNWVAVGRSSGYSNVSGINWTALGFSAGFSNIGGNNWTAIGWQAGRYLIDGTTAATLFDSCTYVGYNTKVSSNTPGLTNENVFGHTANGKGSNTVAIGNSAITANYFYGTVLTGGKASLTANGGDVQVTKGITFPATQVACSDANTLDDYEEGAWTPALTDGTISIVFSRYTKVGRLVYFDLRVGISTATRTTGTLFTGLPFPVAGDWVCTCISNDADGINLTGFLANDGSMLEITKDPTVSVNSTLLISATLRVTGFYQTTT